MRVLFAFLFSVTLSQSLWAQNDEDTWPRISELTWMDRNHFEQQRQYVDELARVEYGRPIRGDKSDLTLLQRIVNDGLIPGDETQNLQALGAVLGDVYVEQHDLVWRVYEDEKGRSRAVCIPDTVNCIFPVTMLSRRIAAGLVPDVEEVYNKGLEIIEPYLPKRPFDGR